MERFYGNVDNSKYLSVFKDAEKNGIGTLSIQSRNELGGRITTKIYLKLNKDKVEKYKARSKYIVASAKILNIDGISLSGDKTKATVRFTYQYKQNELYPLIYLDNLHRGCNMEIIEDEVTFTKFDSGWKMDRQKNKKKRKWN